MFGDYATVTVFIEKVGDWYLIVKEDADAEKPITLSEKVIKDFFPLQYDEGEVVDLEISETVAFKEGLI